MHEGLFAFIPFASQKKVDRTLLKQNKNNKNNKNSKSNKNNKNNKKQQEKTRTTTKNTMRVPENAGRFFAMFVAVPLLIVISALLLTHPETASKPSAAVLIAFSVLFFAYEAMWVGGALTHA